MEIDVTPDDLINNTTASYISSEKISKHEEEHVVEVAPQLLHQEPCGEATNQQKTQQTSSGKSGHNSNKKIIKHALRQQAKRRKKNTTIASGNSATVPRIIVKPLPPPVVYEEPLNLNKTPTMREVLASIPGFTMKPRKRTNKKLSTAAQLEQTKEGCIDLETPDSILVHTNLRLLLNKATFASLPLLYQHKLVQLLPGVDRHIASNSADSSGGSEISNTGLNNEFFARACVEWQDRLAEGEFTPENQQKLKLEADKERSKLDPWKLKHFEPIWGDRINSDSLSTRPPIKTTIKLRPTTVSNKNKPPVQPPKRLRTVGAVTRSCSSYNSKTDEYNCNNSESGGFNNNKSLPDLLPIRSLRHKNNNEAPKIKPESVTVTESDTLEYKSDIVDPDFDPLDTSLVTVSEETAPEKPETIVSFNCDKRRRLSASPVYDREDNSIEIVNDKACAPPSESSEHDNSSTKSEDSVSNTVEHIQVSGAPEEPPIDECDPLNKEIIVNDDISIIPIIHEENSLEKEQQSSTLELSELETDLLPPQQEPYPVLPNTLILEQDTMKLELQKTGCSESCAESCIEAEKLEASVEESDLVIAQLGAASFETGVDEVDANEDRFIDAENYVLESGQIPVVEAEKLDEERTDVDIAATLFGAPAVSAGSEECCWDLVDPTEKLLEVPIDALESVGGAPVEAPQSATEHVEVIPMQEELEVRLQEGTFPVPNDWSYDVKMDSQMVAAALGTPETSTQTTPEEKQLNPPAYPEYQQPNQLKLELEVTLTPELITTSNTTPCSTPPTPTSNVPPTPNNKPTIPPAVIPPTTIVCLPSIANPIVTTEVSPAMLPSRPGLLQSSSSLPYLALSTSQPLRAVSTHHTKNAKPKSSLGANNRRSNNKPPPGAVNLERSYQICQAVIQNSPNRDQLRCQLKPPPSLLAAAAANSAAAKKVGGGGERTQYGSVTTSSARVGGGNCVKTFTPPLPATQGGFAVMGGGNGVKGLGQKGGRGVQFQRQPSPPVVVRHVFTSGQIPVTMAVLPQAPALTPEVMEGPNPLGTVGQYILVQRAGVNNPHHAIPRSSSAPPSQQQIGTPINTGVSQIVSVGTARGRPASVDTDHPSIQMHGNPPTNDFIVQCPNPGTQAVTRRQRVPPGVVYGDVSVDSFAIIGGEAHPGAAMQPLQTTHLVVGGKVRGAEGAPAATSCACSLKAMVVCKKCGAFCHDDCISPNKLCRVCFIR